MTGNLREYIGLPLLPAGRRIHALQSIMKDAVEHHAHHIARVADEAMGINQEARRMRQAWLASGGRGDRTRARAAAAELGLSRVLGGILQMLEGLTQTHSATDTGERAGELRAVLFPEGLAPIVSRNFEAELRCCAAMLDVLGADQAATVVALGLESSVAALGESISRFRDALEHEGEQLISSDQLRQAEHDGEEALLRVVVHVMATYDTGSDGDSSMRGRLLSHVTAHARRVVELARRGCALTDVDPTTGSELPLSMASEEGP